MNQIDARDPIPAGTLGMLILQTLSLRGPLHGFEIATAIEERSGGVLRVEEGSLYPALQRLLIDGSVIGQWGRTHENRRARYYRLTPAGQRHLASELERHRRVFRAVSLVLRPA
jgi:PadR family transcriptional regulator, regulatory protein PadR